MTHPPFGGTARRTVGSREIAVGDKVVPLMRNATARAVATASDHIRSRREVRR